MDYRAFLLMGGTLVLLALASGVVEYLKRRPNVIDVATLSNFRSRIQAWWLLFGSLICALLIGKIATVFVFGMISFWALREYVTITPTRPSDHKMLVGVFFILTPLQFFLVGADSGWFADLFGYEPYFFYSALLPSLAFLILPAVVAATDDTKYYLERIGKLQVGLLICVYSFSFAPALLTMELYSTTTPTVAVEGVAQYPLEESVKEQTPDVINIEPDADSDAAVFTPFDPSVSNRANSSARRKLDSVNVLLLFMFVVLTQVSDVAQYFWSLAFPKHKIAPRVNAIKTYEGVTLGVLTTAFFSIAFSFCLPFDHWSKSALAGVVISCMGFAGNITLSAIKRDQGIDYRERLIDGHADALDRVDSLCFAAPVFFHMVKIMC